MLYSIKNVSSLTSPDPRHSDDRAHRVGRQGGAGSLLRAGGLWGRKSPELPPQRCDLDSDLPVYSYCIASFPLFEKQVKLLIIISYIISISIYPIYPFPPLKLCNPFYPYSTCHSCITLHSLLLSYYILPLHSRFYTFSLLQLSTHINPINHPRRPPHDGHGVFVQLESSLFQRDRGLPSSLDEPG